MKNDWDEVPVYIKDTFERLGIPKAERESLAGVGAQYDSEVVYHNIRQELSGQGVIYTDMETAVREHEDTVRSLFMKLVPPEDHKFVALHGAVWSGGSYVYVPEGVRLDIPLQSYFRLNAPGAGQFEHTLIVVEKGASVHFIEGCSAPKYNVVNLHAGCVELYVREGATLRYSTIENWSKNMMNLNTKRAQVEKNGKTLKNSLDNLRRQSISVEAAAAPTSMISRFILNCGSAAVMLVGSSLLEDGSLSLMLYIAFMLIAINIYQPVMTLFYFITDFKRLNRSARRIEDISREKPFPEPVVDRIPRDSSVEFSQVSFGYGEKEVLEDISFMAPANSMTALVGASGSGKSTVIRLIARFWDVDKGAVLVGDVPVTNMKNDTLLSHITMVFQDVPVSRYHRKQHPHGKAGCDHGRDQNGGQIGRMPRLHYSYAKWLRYSSGGRRFHPFGR